MRSFKIGTGFSLIEIVTILTIVSIMTVAILILYQSSKESSRISGTKQRMQLIRAKLEEYYCNHQRLPNAFHEDQVTIQAEALDLVQKFRLDQWGKFFEYLPGNATNIHDVEGYAATIKSSGPDQKMDQSEDNLKVFVDLTKQATKIATDKLQVLQEKVQAYEAIFAGIDNDGDDVIDNLEDLGAKAEINATINTNSCPPTHSFTNDPSGGLATLDQLAKNPDYYGCKGHVVDQLAEMYDLPIGFPDGYNRDPWNRPFKWGAQMDSKNPRYHRFYSQGPNNSTAEDDIFCSGG